jgi:hypothetical protein
MCRASRRNFPPRKAPACRAPGRGEACMILRSKFSETGSKIIRGRSLTTGHSEFSETSSKIIRARSLLIIGRVA